MEESFYMAGMEYPTVINITKDPKFEKMIDKYERLLENDELTPQHKEEVDMVLMAFDYCERIYYDLEIEKERSRELEDQIYNYKKRYGY
ncbi:hypothetical protein [Allofustis seminis]|uniref:hypothetical protein n=1 Tax=Allofustis seminis TaxID=166939 RepID=UPI0003739EF5|nr:hypothetical protein [Allofustis seminis]